ncbi:energy transducer TonB [Salegentibacter sp. F188]|uniref:Energy transducer TonB n=1 Tax=Autumnicola patrickiae TaxID=3075591 RepID=A0ABU3E4Y5_9FLAO|nr:energy transducer TonB [Salegentibacter sp. F188]MDT0690985.1 energy transducer TonB [Salegentibacter sp. F188]
METKKNPKVDLGRGSVIFFQIGLILILSSTYFALEWKTYEKDNYDKFRIEVPQELQEDIPITQMSSPPPPPPPPPPAIPEIISVVEDELDIEEDPITSTESSQDDKLEKVVQVAEINDGEVEEVVEQVPFILVEHVPTYPGCENEKDNEAKKICLTKRIDAFVKREFDTSIGAELGLSGINRIIVMFKIDEVGDIVDIKSRGPHKMLEDEAERVINMLPKMTPGMQRNKPVRVQYSLPIVFDVRQKV